MLKLQIAINTTACDGSDVFWPWLLWLLGAFLLGLLLGWLLKQLFGDKGGDTYVAGDSVKDDLTKVEGIGPKIQHLMNDAGIWSFHQLSYTRIDKLQQVLDDAGSAYTVHNPRTWSAQARLADEKHWEELKIWQDFLKGGL